jgi:parvulin-like peptidyl-prolyl isomerase
MSCRVHGVFRGLFISALLAGLVVFTGVSCKKRAAGGEVVARVGEAVITKEQFQAELARRAKAGWPLASAAQREAVLEEMVRLEVFYAKAVAAGYAKDPELQAQFRRMLAGKYDADQRAKRPAVKRPEPGEIELHYKNNQAQFTAPERVHPAVIFIKVPTKAGAEQVAKAQERAEQIHQKAVEQAAQQASFGLLAQENSDDQATRYRGGDAGWITREQTRFSWDKSVVEAAFAMQKPGEVGPLLRAPEGFYVLKLMERKAAETQPLEQVRDRISHQLLAAARKQADKEFYEQQKAGLAISISQELLSRIEAPPQAIRTNAPMPPSMPR